MDLNDLLIFRAVVDEGSFTAAGDALGLPKSNISRRVSRLENALGTRLLERSTRSLGLTEAGRVWYRQSQLVDEAVQAGRERSEALSATPSGLLRVCASVATGETLLAPHLPDFMKLYPDIRIDLQLVNRRVDLIEEGYDLVIRLGELPDAGLIARKLGETCLKLFASKAYIERSGTKLTSPTQLADHRCLHMNALGGRPLWALGNGDEQIEQTVEPVLASDNFRVLEMLAADGGGIALLPGYFHTNENLVPVLEHWRGPGIVIHALYPDRRSMTPKLRAFLDFMENRISLSCEAEQVPV